MKKALLAMVLVMGICFSAMPAQAIPTDTLPFFAYDDFTLTFGAAGQPGAAGGTIAANGKVLDGVNGINVDGWFTISGVTAAGAQPVGSQYDTTYTGTLDMYTTPAHTTLLWAGNGSLTTIVNANGATFPNIYAAPGSFFGQPTNFNSIGYGSFVAVGVNTWPYPILSMDWFGTFNWSYDVSSNGTWTPTTTQQYGNTQGVLAAPEPSLLLLFGSGLVGLGLFRRKRG